MGVERKWAFMSIEMKRAPSSVSEMVLLIMSLVSSRSDAGKPVSSSYGRQSHPIIILILLDSYFKGLQSHTKVAFVTDLS